MKGLRWVSSALPLVLGCGGEVASAEVERCQRYGERASCNAVETCQWVTTESVTPLSATCTSLPIVEECVTDSDCASGTACRRFWGDYCGKDAKACPTDQLPETARLCRPPAPEEP
jgi:hypothetical protein